MPALKLTLTIFLLLLGCASAQPPKLGTPAPLFTAQTHDGKPFDLKAREGGPWTVLFFYPKAHTPGCTKQVCAYRDAHKIIEAQGAQVFGISADTVKTQAEFHAEHGLNFPLIADPDAKVIKAFGATMPMVSLAKRWTFILDPALTIRWVEQDVDPMLDAKR
ncbi:peroxiredoxin, partial [Myxococcota bacterium]|nr:peroxiredoxin [Myxococcota bacterium]